LPPDLIFQCTKLALQHSPKYPNKILGVLLLKGVREVEEGEKGEKLGGKKKTEIERERKR